MATYLNGIDISKWQPTTPKLDGLSFAFARATYATVIDPKYAMHVANFRKAGLVVGAYCFGVGFKPVHEQVRVFLAAAKGADLLVLDLERDSTKTMTQAEAREFIRLVHATGRKIGLYHSRSGFLALGQDFNWIAQWRSIPPTGITWAFWQWQGSPLDRDKFNGTKAQLLALAGRAPQPKEAQVSDRATVLTNAIAKNEGYLANKGALEIHRKVERFKDEVAAIATFETAKAALASEAEWTGTYEAAYDRFIAAADEFLIAAGKPAGHGAEPRGSIPRDTCIDIATKLGVLDELGGPNFFGVVYDEGAST